MDASTHLKRINNRGGFYYELNELFAALLHELGFRVILLVSIAAIPGRSGLHV